MIDIEFNKIPYTGGRFYDYIDRETFVLYEKRKDMYELKDLVPGGLYTFYRIARNELDEIVYMRISGSLIDIKNNEMFFMHSPGKGKSMILNGYKEHWFFVKE